MATDIDEKLLDEILTDLEKARSWTPRTIAKLESLIHSEDEFALFRINPILQDQGYGERIELMASNKALNPTIRSLTSKVLQ